MRVCIGGTFDILHKGHKLLIDKAFQIAGKQGSVFIGLTTGKIIKEKRDVKPFEKRRGTIMRYLSKKKLADRAIIKPIKDKYGPSLEGDFDAIVVSPETMKTAEEINRIRRQNGRKPLEIVQIPFVLADNGIAISSLRIRRSEIDENGRILR